MLNLFTKIIAVTAIVVVTASISDAHEWTIDGNKVQANAIDVNSTHVLLQDRAGIQKAVRLNRLANRDVKRLSSLVNIASSRQTLNLQREQLKAQRISAMSRYSSAWRVAMVDRNGVTGSRVYFADNSRAATKQARHEFPNVRVMNVSKIQDSGFSNSNFVLPPVNQWMIQVNSWGLGSGSVAVPYILR